MTKAHASAKRRLGRTDSPMSSAMLDATETILRDEGYGALTSRRVAEVVEVKQRLVYYYFHTMDDLIVAAFRRLAVRELGRLTDALAAADPLGEVWTVCIASTDARLVSEFMALANRLEPLRSQVIAFIEQSRALQVEALTRAFGGEAAPLPPAVLAVLATSVSLALRREEALGIHSGHAETFAVIRDFLHAHRRAE